MYLLKEFNFILIVLILVVVFGLLVFAAMKAFCVGVNWINEWFNKYMP